MKNKTKTSLVKRLKIIKIGKSASLCPAGSAGSSLAKLNKRAYQKPRLLAVLALFLITSMAWACENSKSSPPIGAGNLLVGTTDYISGAALALIDLNDRSVSAGIHDGLHQDHRLRKIYSEIYLVVGGANNITHLGDGLSIIYEEGTGRNPYDVAPLANGLGVIALYDEGHLSLFNRQSGVIDSSLKIDISSYDSDGVPEASALHRQGNYVYAAMQTMYRRSSFPWVPRGNGTLVKIDINSRVLVELEAMPYANPLSDFSYYRGDLDGGGSKDWLIITTVGAYGANDAGVLAYDIAANRWKTLLSEMSVMQDTLSAVVVSDTLAFAILSNSSFQNSLTAFNPSTGERIGPVLISETFLGSLLYHNGKLYVADRTTMQPGVRIFDVNTLTEDSSEPIDVGLPPNSLLLLE